MAIPSRQIGWSTKANLLWEISKQLEAISGAAASNGSPYVKTDNVTITTSTTSTTTTSAPGFSYFANYSTTSGPAACYQAQDQFSIYSSTAIGNGVAIFTDGGLTTPAPDGYYSVSGATYDVAGGVIYSVGSCPATSAFSYVISQTDLDASTGNTDTNLNGKIFALTADDGSGNPSSRTFTASGSYNHWLCSADPITPTFGYYASNAFITVGLVSTQTNIGAC